MRPSCALWPAIVVATAAAGRAWGQTPVPEAAQPLEVEEGEAAEEVTVAPAIDPTPPLVFLGYVDVGFADAEGDGTSFRRDDGRFPIDYGVDPFAPAVNTRGDVASNDTRGVFNNGFLPRSVNIGGRPSFLLNVVSLDLRYAPAVAPIMVFTRIQALPRFVPGQGNETTLYVQQAFGRVTPFSSRELTLSVGKFDSVFGIEYLENESNFRIGITPSLFARYTTGTSIGAKAFYRHHIAPLWSAVSINAAATNSGAWIEALQPPDASLTGRPNLSVRLGYELNLPMLQVKLGASGLRGPRNDQFDPDATQTMMGLDARVNAFGFSLSGELMRVEQERGSTNKQTGMAEFLLASAFEAEGGWAQLAYGYPIDLGPLRVVTGYARFEQRHAWFEGFRAITVQRLTAGLRLDLWEALLLKGEVLFNEERAGVANVDNDVLAFSAVYSW